MEFEGLINTVEERREQACRRRGSMGQVTRRVSLFMTTETDYGPGEKDVLRNLFCCQLCGEVKAKTGILEPRKN